MKPSNLIDVTFDKVINVEILLFQRISSFHLQFNIIMILCIIGKIFQDICLLCFSLLYNTFPTKIKNVNCLDKIANFYCKYKKFRNMSRILHK